LAPKESQKLVVVPSQQDEGRENRLYDVKKRVHHCLLERLDLSQLEELDEKLRAKEIRQAIGILLVAGNGEQNWDLSFPCSAWECIA
ncbi:MAG: hypothetical protein R6W80_16075, partial [Haliea sp.]